MTIIYYLSKMVMFILYYLYSNITFTVGRKNWLFSASPKGAASSAIVYTMVEMAKANDLNTYKYLTYLLSQRPDAKMSDEQLEQLAPWSETAKANCQN